MQNPWNGSFGKARRYVSTVSHLKPWQVVGRVVAPARRHVTSYFLPEVPSRLHAKGDPRVEFPHHDPWNRRQEILEGRFCFLNEDVALGRPVRWSVPEQPMLWRFNLHYFDYLHLLEPMEQVTLCREWIAQNPVGSEVGWHPYPTSLRLVNWCRAGLEASDVLESLYRQAVYLHRNVETHVYGNHLLENARALVLAGEYLRGQGEADRWRERGLKIYKEELTEQVFSDGFHYERSPMYHALVLEGLLDVLNVLPEECAERARLTEVARVMTDALCGVVHPDGTLALFNDATHEIAPPPKRLLQYGREVLRETFEARTSLPEAGYYVQEGNDLWMMIDGGAAGPDHLMAHAHADVFSYELSLFGERFVVDGGVYQYEPGPMRQYARGTEAHNTVQVDDLDQIEVWDSFRVARRSSPSDVHWTETSGGATFEGTFDGYRDRVGDSVTHRREVEIDEQERRVQVRDHVTGTGTHRVTSRIRLHPEVEVSRTADVFVLERGGNECRLKVDRGRVERETGWYCPQFGVRHRICVLAIGGEVSLPVRFSYQIRY